MLKGAASRIVTDMKSTRVDGARVGRGHWCPMSRHMDFPFWEHLGERVLQNLNIVSLNFGGVRE